MNLALGARGHQRAASRRARLGEALALELLDNPIATDEARAGATEASLAASFHLSKLYAGNRTEHRPWLFEDSHHAAEATRVLEREVRRGTDQGKLVHSRRNELRQMLEAHAGESSSRVLFAEGVRALRTDEDECLGTAFFDLLDIRLDLPVEASPVSIPEEIVTAAFLVAKKNRLDVELVEDADSVPRDLHRLELQIGVDGIEVGKTTDKEACRS
jgi:hypothetical protein